MRVLKINGLVLMVLFLAAAISYAQTVEEYPNKGLEYGAQGKFEEEEKEFKSEVAAHLFKGMIYVRERMFDEAIAEYKKAIAINPNYAEAHYDLAVAYYYKRQYNLSIEHCDRALELGAKVHPGFLEDLKPYRK